MKSDNYYLRQIAKNTGSEVSKMKNNVLLLKQIAYNLGADVSGKLKTANQYLKLISEKIAFLNDKIVVSSDKDIIQVDEVAELQAEVTIDGEKAVGETVSFYVED